MDDQNRVVGIIAQADVSLAAEPEKVHKTVAEIAKAQPSDPPVGKELRSVSRSVGATHRANQQHCRSFLLRALRNWLVKMPDR